MVLDAATGVRLSNYERPSGPVAVAGGAVVFLDDRLVAFDGRTGRERWSLTRPQFQDHRESCSGARPAPDACTGTDVLYLPTVPPAADQPGRGSPDRDRPRPPPAPGVLVHRIDLLRGAALPDLGVDIGTQHTIRLEVDPLSGVLMFVDGSTYRAFDAVTGEPLWSSPGPAAGATIVGIEKDRPGQDLVYVRGSATIEAREVRTGLLSWTQVPARPDRLDWFEAARGSDVVDEVDDSGHLTYRGLDARTGAVRWSTPMGLGNYEIAVEGGHVMFARLAAGQPPLVLGVVCSPQGSHPGRPPKGGCSSRRLVAVNW